MRHGERTEDRLGYEPGFVRGAATLPARAAIGVTGLALLGLGLRRRGAARLVFTALGAGAVTRAVTNLNVVQLVGTFTMPVVKLRRTVIVQAPVESVYEFWKNFSNYPKFMSYIRDVEVNEKGGLQWTAMGPRGLRVRWDSIVGAMRQNQLITWRSTPDSLITNEGKVSMTGDYQRTKLTIELTYGLPVGAFGYAIVRLLGFDPRERIDHDLEIMRRMIEGSERPELRAASNSGSVA